VKRSTDRMLATHIGSLPRPSDLLDLMEARESGGQFDQAAFDARVREAVADVVRRQADIGLDVVNDGEQGKVGFITYANERLSGFEPRPERPGGRPHFGGSREHQTFPDFYEQVPGGGRTFGFDHLLCTGPVAYTGQAQLQKDLDNLKAALAGVQVEEAFLPAVSPSNFEEWHKNRYYDTEEEYLFAIADALHVEYKAIVDAGFLLQVDDPNLVTYYNTHPSASIEDCRRWAEPRIDALNHALRDIPQDRVRFHTCYGINIGPRVHDMELKHIVDLMLRVRAGAYSFEAANPRHEHEWKVWEEAALPDDAVLIPGVITNSGVVVEHPEVVAQRLARFAGVVGRERVIAGADCGFATFATSRDMPPSVIWAKLEALAEGARVATRELWGSRASV
jgi:5-methyltetrahydropteroyltriglutamate--homocysteine methyltransferase